MISLFFTLNTSLKHAHKSSHLAVPSPVLWQQLPTEDVPHFSVSKQPLCLSHSHSQLTDWLTDWLTNSQRLNSTLHSCELLLILVMAQQGLYTIIFFKQSFYWRMPSSGMLRCVALVRTDVSEEPSASNIRVTRIDALGTTLVITRNWLSCKEMPSEKGSVSMEYQIEDGERSGG
jgi:hypothetical protein